MVEHSKYEKNTCLKNLYGKLFHINTVNHALFCSFFISFYFYGVISSSFKFYVYLSFEFFCLALFVSFSFSNFCTLTYLIQFSLLI